MEVKKLKSPLTKEVLSVLKAGDMVSLTGTIYAARDAAHKRLIEMIDKNEKLPFDLQNQIVFYAGPSPNKPNEVIGSVGPTTSYRMDAYSPKLIELGLLSMIGKGKRGKEVIDAIVKYGGCYFTAIGGAAAYMSNCVKESKIIAFEDLGTEAIREMFVEDMPLIVTIDSHGNNALTV
ncbi:Fe-S-containing hydro-lyase [Brachyspira hampsonii]|uniref:Fe-S-containing hydro-lyase n=1 Tax=Brachyspira hampsonii TaxID=1287055 RepID=UPI000D399DA0|nr:Fe-S-containing hydro-lyase [Brachyspira hampsonii]PTY41464.1 fumarate hydratase [Brachyspira hampsonii bv. II]